jgi:hypothetical protein
MANKKRPVLIMDDQALLDGVTLRPITAQEREGFDQLMVEEHYLKSSRLVGEQLRYVAVYQNRWVALMSWSAGAYHLKDREAWIQWTPKQKERRLPLAVNNSRFHILEQFRVPNLASRVMKLCIQRLSDDWLETYGHEVLVAESFVDSQQFLGTCYKANGWTLLGLTKGYQRHRQDYYIAHDRPKQLWVLELRPGARTILRGVNLPQALRGVEIAHGPECVQEPKELEAMKGFFANLPDWRTRQGDYSVSSLVTVAVCAMLSGVCLGQRDLAAFASDLTRPQMAALRFPYRGNPRRYQVPGETTFYRLLCHLDSRALEKALLDWQNHVLGPPSRHNVQVSVDGKELINSQGVKVTSAYSVTDGRWMGSELVAQKSNEIPATQALLRKVDIQGALVTADALHTQTETARIIVQEKGADYLFTVKGNQKTVADSVRQLKKGLEHAFSPSA